MVTRRWPVEAQVTVVFETSGSMVIPVLSQIKRGGWTDSNSYISAQCTAGNNTSSQANVNATAARLFKRQKRQTISDPTDPFNIGTPLTKASGIATYILDSPYNNVGVVYIGAYADGNDFRQAYLQGLDKMNSSGVEYLIIEVSGNGGGSVANGHYVEQVLFPDKFPGFPTEARAPQIAVDCANNLALGAKTSGNLYDYRQYCKVGPFVDVC